LVKLLEPLFHARLARVVELSAYGTRFGPNDGPEGCKEYVGGAQIRCRVRR